MINIDTMINEAKGTETVLKGTVGAKQKPQYVDIQLERAVDILKGIEVYAKRSGAP